MFSICSATWESSRKKQSQSYPQRKFSHAQTKSLYDCDIFVSRFYTIHRVIVTHEILKERNQKQSQPTSIFWLHFTNLFRQKSTSGKIPIFFWRKTNKKHSRHTANIRHTKKKWMVLINWICTHFVFSWSKAIHINMTMRLKLVVKFWILRENIEATWECNSVQPRASSVSVWPGPPRGLQVDYLNRLLLGPTTF